MDSEPSPQCVGQEFVRQYYTMLHKAPQFMHRFYSHDSSFVHGGIEKPGEEMPPIRGQMEIHKKILSLEFKDCHAKIRQVDSQASIDSAVVVQVAGELSNNGQLMRRFMQTFVLAPQSPKKYYLHNDIFRYQDEVFHDDIEDSAGLGNAAGQEEYGYVAEEIEQQQPAAAEESESAVPYYDGGVVEQQQPLSNGGESYHTEDMDDSGVGLAGPQPQMSEASNQQQPESPAAVELAQPAAEAEGVEPAVVEPEPAAVVSKSEEAESVAAVSAPTVAEPVPAQKPTWAAMASRNTPAAVSGSAVVPAAKPQATIRPEPKTEQRYPAQNGSLPQRPPRVHVLQPQRRCTACGHGHTG